jgi:hypothetical protein
MRQHYAHLHSIDADFDATRTPHWITVIQLFPRQWPRDMPCHAGRRAATSGARLVHRPARVRGSSRVEGGHTPRHGTRCTAPTIMRDEHMTQHRCSTARDLRMSPEPPAPISPSSLKTSRRASRPSRSLVNPVHTDGLEPLEIALDAHRRDAAVRCRDHHLAVRVGIRVRVRMRVRVG